MDSREDTIVVKNYGKKKNYTFSSLRGGKLCDTSRGNMGKNPSYIEGTNRKKR